MNESLDLNRFITRPRLDSVPLKASSNFLSHFHKLSLLLAKVTAEIIHFKEEKSILVNIAIIIFANV